MCARGHAVSRKCFPASEAAGLRALDTWRQVHDVPRNAHLVVVCRLWQEGIRVLLRSLLSCRATVCHCRRLWGSTRHGRLGLLSHSSASGAADPQRTSAQDSHTSCQRTECHSRNMLLCNMPNFVHVRQDTTLLSCMKHVEEANVRACFAICKTENVELDADTFLHGTLHLWLLLLLLRLCQICRSLRPQERSYLHQYFSPILDMPEPFCSCAACCSSPLAANIAGMMPYL